MLVGPGGCRQAMGGFEGAEEGGFSDRWREVKADEQESVAVFIAGGGPHARSLLILMRFHGWPW